MTLLQRFNRLGLWGRLGAVGSVASVIGLGVAVLPSHPARSLGPQVQQRAGVVKGDQLGVVYGDVVKGDKEIDIHVPPKLVEKHILDNDGAATLVLKSAQGGLLPSNQVGLAPVGTVVKLLGEEHSGPGPMKFAKVEIVSPQLAGRVGWVSLSTVRTVREPE